MLFILLLLIPIFASSLELNLICTNNSANSTEVDVKDIFVLINTDEEVVEDLPPVKKNKNFRMSVSAEVFGKFN